MGKESTVNQLRQGRQDHEEQACVVCQRSTAVGWGAVLSEGEPMGDAPAFTLVMFTACISDRKGLAAARAESRLLKGEEL